MIEELRKLTLLYVEDDKKIREEYLKTFNLLFKHTFTASDFNDIMMIHRNKSPDLILIDIELKQRYDGFDIAEEIRKSDAITPIIFLTGHGEVDYIYKAINSSINGYIIKPLDLPTLIGTIKKSLLFVKECNLVYINKDLSYNLSTYELVKDNRKVKLGKKENQLLYFLLKNRNKTLGKEELEYEIWNEKFVTESALKNLIANLRKKIGKDKILNISGFGWKIKID